MKASFDRLAGIYQTLEFLAFGGDLERARFGLLDRLAGCKSILVLGEGDGRCLRRLSRLAPEARIHCVDLSAAMIARAAARLAPAEQERVRLQCANALSLELEAGAYDAVVTLFFLDCFTGPEVEQLVKKIGAAARPEALWLFADFTLPAKGWRRARARVWLAVLYAFFRWQTSLSARSLPSSEAIMRADGWRELESRSLQSGMLRTAIYCRAGGMP